MRDFEMQYFVEILKDRKKQIEKNIKEALKEIEELGDLELNDEGDCAAVCTDNMIEQAISTQQLKELKEINEALKKIKQGTYGICEMCGEQIGIQRLKVKPHAKYCITCREIIEKSKKGG